MHRGRQPWNVKGTAHQRFMRHRTNTITSLYPITKGTINGSILHQGHHRKDGLAEKELSQFQFPVFRPYPICCSGTVQYRDIYHPNITQSSLISQFRGKTKGITHKVQTMKGTTQEYWLQNWHQQVYLPRSFA